MGTLSVETLVSAPVEGVFAVYTDLERAVERIPDLVALELLSEGPFGQGTRWRETRRFMKKEATEEMWVTGCDPPRSYTVEAESNGCRYSTLFSFDAEGGQTRVRWDFTSTPLSLGGKIVGGIFSVLMKGVMKKCMLRDLEALRAVCESGQA